MTCESFATNATNKIIIQAPTPTGDAYGGRTNIFSNQSTVWAEIIPMSGKEIFTQGATQSRITHKFIIRYQAALKNITTVSNYRISFDGRYFGIVHLRNLDETRKFHGNIFQEILAVENGADIYG